MFAILKFPKVEDGHREMMTIPIKIFKVLDMNFMCIKKDKRKFANFCMFKRIPSTPQHSEWPWLGSGARPWPSGAWVESGVGFGLAWPALFRPPWELQVTGIAQ